MRLPLARGTIYRNYFAPVNGETGQSADNQIDCLADIGSALGNTDSRLWQMKNGYVLPHENSLAEITRHLQSLNQTERDALQGLLRIGIQWNTQVTLNGCKHTVSQAYCSALPVAYSHYPSCMWEPFARLVLEAAYEATICAATLNMSKKGDTRLFLTLLGGGAFGNETAWIIKAIERAVARYRKVPLNVAVVSYGVSNYHVRQLAGGWSS